MQYTGYIQKLQTLKQGEISDHIKSFLTMPVLPKNTVPVPQDKDTTARLMGHTHKTMGYF